MVHPTGHPVAGQVGGRGLFKMFRQIAIESARRSQGLFGQLPVAEQLARFGKPDNCREIGRAVFDDAPHQQTSLFEVVSRG